MSETITIPRRFQGVTDRGQGGYAAGVLAERIDGPARADFFNPIPVDRPLELRESVDRLELVDDQLLILRVRPFDGSIRRTDPVTIDEAEAARNRSPIDRLGTAPECFSCGTIPESMHVHAGPLLARADYATPWTAPPWASSDHGTVLARFIWAAIDCPSGWRATSMDADPRRAVTGQMETEIFGRIVPDHTYALVAWAEPWRGRRVTAGTALFDELGTCLAASQSVWIST